LIIIKQLYNKNQGIKFARINSILFIFTLNYLTILKFYANKIFKDFKMTNKIIQLFGIYWLNNFMVNKLRTITI
jgi:hypothetical protein